METAQLKKKIKTLLMKHEGFRDYPYLDTTGNLTIGYGHNLNAAMPISRNVADLMLEEDINYFYDKLRVVLPYFDHLSENRKIVLINMCFNLGLNGLLKFRKMLLAISNKDYHRAAEEMLKSKWATQVGNRARELAQMMK